MLEHSSKNISISLANTKLSQQALVCISFEATVCGCCLKRLGCGVECCIESCDCFPKEAEETTVCWALYSLIRRALTGSPDAALSSGVTNVCCGSSKGAFYICWSCKGANSAVRKALGIVVKNLKPARAYSDYSVGLRTLGGSPARNYFNKAANTVKASIDKKIEIMIVGKVKADKDALKKVIEVLDNKIDTGDNLSPAQANTTHSVCPKSEKSTVLSVHGWEAFIGYLFVKDTMRGVNVSISSAGLNISTTPSKWETFSGKYKDKLNDYVERRYGKSDVKEELEYVLACMAVAQCALPPSEIKSMIKSCTKLENVVSALKKIIK